MAATPRGMMGMALAYAVSMRGGDISLEMESKLIMAVTGLDIFPKDLFAAGERIIHHDVESVNGLLIRKWMEVL